jgi:copper(I)-binding protein
VRKTLRASDARLRTPAAFLAAGLTTLTLAALAAAPALSAADAWIRATPGTDVAAAYLTLTNSGALPVTVIGVRSSVAGMAMIHETHLIGTQSSMRAREQLTLAPKETVRFAPGGLHVMLHMLTHALKPGEDVTLVLLLKGGDTLDVVAHVRPLGQE